MIDWLRERRKEGKEKKEEEEEGRVMLVWSGVLCCTMYIHAAAAVFMRQCVVLRKRSGNQHCPSSPTK